MKKISILMIAILLLAVTSVSAKPIINAAGNSVQIIVSGMYVPFQGNKSLIPVGEPVDIVCQHGSENNTISTEKTIVKNNGNYQIKTKSGKCAVGDLTRACIMQECSDWIEIESVHGNSGSGAATVSIFGVPEYSTLSAGILVLLTGVGIVSLRRKLK